MATSKYGYGKGAALAVDNFFKSYYVAKDMEVQDKRQQFLTLLEGIKPQLESDTVPFSQKTKLAKVLLSQAGIKDHSAIENIFGQLDELDQQQIDTGEQQTVVDASNYNKQSVTPDNSGPQVLDSGIAPNLSKPIFKKRGDITPLELKSIFKTKQDQIDFKQDIEKARVIGDIQDTRELNRLKAQGWKGTDEILYDTDKKQYFQQLTNPFTNEVQRYYYPENAVPKSTIEKRISSSGLTGKYKMLSQAEEDIASYEKDGVKSGISEGRYLAAKRVIEADNSGQDVREALSSYYGTRNKGELPIQPGQQASLDIQNQNRNEDLNLKLSDAEAKIIEFETEYSSKGNEVRGAAENLSKAKIDLDNGDIDQKQYNLIEKQFNDAVEDMNRAKAKRDSAIKARDNVKGIINNRGTKSISGSSNNIDTLVEKNKELIKQVRDKNPNTKLTDRQIMQAILNKANKK